MDSQEQIEYKVVDVKSSIKNRYLNRLYGLVQKPLEGFLGITKLNSTYDFLKKHTSGNFFERAIKAIGISYEIDDEDFAKIPKTGPLVVVSNHPLGGIDGIIMGAVLLKVRPDANARNQGVFRLRESVWRQVGDFAKRFGDEGDNPSAEIGRMRRNVPVGYGFVHPSGAPLLHS